MAASRAAATKAVMSAGSLTPGCRLDAGGDIDPGRAADVQCLADIAGVEAARQEIGRPCAEAGKQGPVEGNAKAAGPVGILRRLGIEQQPVGDPGIGGGGGEIVRIANADRLDHGQPESCLDGGDPFRALAAMELQPVGADRFDEPCHLVVSHVDGDGDGLRASTRPRRQPRGGPGRDIAGAARKKHESDHVGAGIERRVERLLGRQTAYLHDQAHGHGFGTKRPMSSTRWRARVRSSASEPRIDQHGRGEILDRRADRLEQRDLVVRSRRPAACHGRGRRDRRRCVFRSERRSRSAGRYRRPRAARRRGCRHRRAPGIARVVGLAHRGIECADEVDMGAGPQPRAVDQRFAAQRRRELRCRRFPPRRQGRCHAHGEAGPVESLGQRLRTRRSPVPDRHRLDRPHARMRGDETRGEGAGAHHRHPPRVARARTRRARAEAAAVRHRVSTRPSSAASGSPLVAVKKHIAAVHARLAARRVAGKHRHQLHPDRRCLAAFAARQAGISSSVASASVARIA